MNINEWKGEHMEQKSWSDVPLDCAPHHHYHCVQHRYNSITPTEPTKEKKNAHLVKTKSQIHFSFFGNWEKVNYFIYSCFFWRWFWARFWEWRTILLGSNRKWKKAKRWSAVFMCLKEELLFYSSLNKDEGSLKLNNALTHPDRLARSPLPHTKKRTLKSKFQMKLLFGFVLQWAALHWFRTTDMFGPPKWKYIDKCLNIGAPHQHIVFGGSHLYADLNLSIAYKTL